MLKELCNIAIKAAYSAGQEILKIYSGRIDVELKADNSPLTQADKNANRVITDVLEVTGIPVLSEESAQVEYSLRKNWDLYWCVDPLDGTREFISKNGEFTVNIALIEKGAPVLGVIFAPVISTMYYGIVKSGAFKQVYPTNVLDIAIEESSGWEKLPCVNKSNVYRVVASRSHLNKETSDYIKKLNDSNKKLETVSRGSSLKLCMIAEGIADIYPRFGPTMEWDIAAGHAIIKASGGTVFQAGTNTELEYNKENLLNPFFIAQRR